MGDRAPTPVATLEAARGIARSLGLRYVYTGNIHDEAGQSTYCHVCGSRVIGRNWHDITFWNLSDDGRCKTCGTSCAGVFAGPCGTWGARRRPLAVNKKIGVP
jgi:pyruvate formate lyase activating enzyme